MEEQPKGVGVSKTNAHENEDLGQKGLRPASAFLTTQWNMVRQAADSCSPQTDHALELVCRNYWYPLYAFARRFGKNHEDAKDLTQGFFHFLISGDAFKKANPELGRFRTFLLSSFKNFILKDHRDATRIKRGGAVSHVSMEWDEAEGRYAHEPQDDLTPERLFDRNWARLMMNSTFSRLQDEYRDSNEQDRFEALRFALEDPGALAYAEVASDLGLSEAGVKSAVHRLRRRFRELFREIVAESLDDPRLVDQELKHIVQSLNS